MIKTGLVGTGYWGKIIESKLDILSKKGFVFNSKNYSKELINSVEWVFIATPPTSHYLLTRDCIESGVNVFVEKPFCINIEEAEELIFLAKKNKVHLYISNVFLHRKEIVKLPNNKNVSNVFFLWQKFGPFNDNLINDLLYHDLYILIYFLGVRTFSDAFISKNEFDVLNFHFYYGAAKVEFSYDRKYIIEKKKEIIIDGLSILFKNDNQDPLSEIIKGCIEKKIDFNKNNELNLQVVRLMEVVKSALSQ